MDEKKNKSLAKVGRVIRDGLITQNPVLTAAGHVFRALPFQLLCRTVSAWALR